jgi:polyphenol oxidase
MTGESVIAADWSAPPGVRALCTTRLAGAELPRLPSAPRWLKQVHGVGVVDLDAVPAGPEPVADASVSAVSGTVCVVRTADCLPVLFAATDGSIVGAAHAGWRGLAAGVLEATVAALRARLAPGIALQAWLGPGISVRHFEVGDDVRRAFVAAHPRAAEAFQAGNGDRWHCDLFAIARQRLTGLGITDISGGQYCSYADETRFYSHRRDVQHRRLDTTGRMASLIWRQT